MVVHQPAPQPAHDARLDAAVVALRQTHAVAAAEPQHVHGHAAGRQQLEVANRLAGREEGVGRALHEQGGDADLRHERVAGAAALEPGAVLGGQVAGGEPLGQRGGDVRVDGPRLHARGADDPERRRGGDAEARERGGPAALDEVVAIERGEQRVPGDRGRDGVDAMVDAGGDELDPARVGRARHAGAGIASGVELLLGLRGEPVQQRGHVAALEVLGVDLDRAARLAEAARVPRQHVEARAAQRPEPDLADGRQRGAVLVLVAHRAPAVASRGWSAPSRRARDPAPGRSSALIGVPSKDVTMTSRAPAVGATTRAAAATAAATRERTRAFIRGTLTHPRRQCAGSCSFVSAGAAGPFGSSSGGHVAGVAAGHVDDLHPGELAHPGQLAAGEVARAALHRLDVAGQQLVEAQRLARGLRGPGGVGGAHLARGARGHHGSTRASMRA